MSFYIIRFPNATPPIERIGEDGCCCCPQGGCCPSLGGFDEEDAWDKAEAKTATQKGGLPAATVDSEPKSTNTMQVVQESSPQVSTKANLAGP